MCRLGDRQKVTQTCVFYMYNKLYFFLFIDNWYFFNISRSLGNDNIKEENQSAINFIDYLIFFMFNKTKLVGKLGHSPKDLHQPTL